MNERIFELAKECGAKDACDNPADREFFERFYKAAHQDGQHAMRERAAKVGHSYEPRCDSCPSGIENAIQNLEIE